MCVFLQQFLLSFGIMQDKLMTSSYSPVLMTKAVKDEKEQQILRDAHVRHLHTLATTLNSVPSCVWVCQPLSPPVTDVAVQVRDAVAVIQLLMWLEKEVPLGTQTELTAAEYVNDCRKWAHVWMLTLGGAVQAAAPESWAMNHNTNSKLMSII